MKNPIVADKKCPANIDTCPACSYNSNIKCKRSFTVTFGRVDSQRRIGVRLKLE